LSEPDVSILPFSGLYFLRLTYFTSRCKREFNQSCPIPATSGSVLLKNSENSELILIIYFLIKITSWANRVFFGNGSSPEKNPVSVYGCLFPIFQPGYNNQEKLKSVLILSEKDCISDKHSVNSYTDFQKSIFAALSVGDIRKKYYLLPAALRNSISGNLQI